MTLQPYRSKAAVFDLFWLDPFDAEVEILRTDVDIRTRLGEGFDDERRQPDASFWIRIAEGAVRSVCMAVC